MTVDATQINILKTASDWARAEIFSDFVQHLFLAVWQDPDSKKAYVIPLLVAGGLLIVIGVGLVISNQMRLSDFSLPKCRPCRRRVGNRAGGQDHQRIRDGCLQGHSGDRCDQCRTGIVHENPGLVRQPDHHYRHDGGDFAGRYKRQRADGSLQGKTACGAAVILTPIGCATRPCGLNLQGVRIRDRVSS